MAARATTEAPVATVDARAAAAVPAAGSLSKSAAAEAATPSATHGPAATAKVAEVLAVETVKTGSARGEGRCSHATQESATRRLKGANRKRELFFAAREEDEAKTLREAAQNGG